MMMDKRFADLKKIPAVPAARLLAAALIKLKTKLKSPTSADVSTVLSELAEAGAWVEAIQLMSVALPPRECVWWACIAAREVTSGEDTPCLLAAEAWVFKPDEANREKVQMVLETVDLDDDTALVATAALYAQGTLGPGEDVKDIPAPPSAVSGCAFGMNIKTLKVVADANQQLQVVLDRALDIARGGNGKITDNVHAEALMS
jgi:hypothetical protein